MEVKLDSKQSELVSGMDRALRTCIAGYIVDHQNEFGDMGQNMANAVLTVLCKMMCSFARVSLDHSNTPAIEAKKNILRMIEMELDMEFKKRSGEVVQ